MYLGFGTVSFGGPSCSIECRSVFEATDVRVARSTEKTVDFQPYEGSRYVELTAACESEHVHDANVC